MSALYAVIAVSNVLGLFSIPAALYTDRTPVAIFGFTCGIVALTSQLTLALLSV